MAGSLSDNGQLDQGTAQGALAGGGTKKDAGQPEGARAKRGLLNHYNETAGHGMEQRDGGSGITYPKLRAVLLPLASS
jgi:hypothetical protein